MSRTVDELEEEARNLSREEQLLLAARLSEHAPASADAPAEQAWLREAERRLQEIHAGKDVLLDLDSVLDEAERVARDEA